MSTEARKIVHRIEDGQDRQEIEATTYQMRNFYRQLADGFFSPLDVFNYMQHHWVAKTLGKPGVRLLDVCCGRGLLLPLLRYHAPKIASYTGVDIAPANAVFMDGKRVTDGKPTKDDSYYPFAVDFVEGNVSALDALLKGHDPFQVIVYTSSIEHMHPDSGRRSLHGCRAVAADDARMLITCPNTPEDQDGYDTRYRAHVYEWKLSELRSGLEASGWRILQEWPLMVDGGVKGLRSAAERRGIHPLVDRLAPLVPSEWLVPLLSPLMRPEDAAEVAILACPE